MTEIQVVDVNEYGTLEATDHVLVDVREIEEYEDGHLPGAVNLPLSTFVEGFRDIPEGKTVVLVCKVGGRSMQAAQFLATQTDLNFTGIVNLDGGTDGWIAGGNPVE
jgi:rhodanese-related sulfurtransferase